MLRGNPVFTDKTPRKLVLLSIGALEEAQVLCSAYADHDRRTLPPGYDDALALPMHDAPARTAALIQRIPRSSVHPASDRLIPQPFQQLEKDLGLHHLAVHPLTLPCLRPRPRQAFREHHSAWWPHRERNVDPIVDDQCGARIIAGVPRRSASRRERAPRSSCASGFEQL